MYEKLVALNDEWVKDGLQRQITDPLSRYDGGVADPETGIAWPSHLGTPKEMAIWTAAVVNKDSAYYRDARLLKALNRAANYMLRFQHEDGTISPGWTNYHSPPDTAFVVVGLAQVYQLLGRRPMPELAETANQIGLFLKRSGTAMKTGGVHTPNHRWVMCAALAYLFELFKDETYRLRAEQWLAEGIDCTEDGEWTERSNGIYNVVSDMMLYHTAVLLDMPELLEPVRRNLSMMVYLVHPSGEVVTDYSGRQDFGQWTDLSGYYMMYALMAKRDRNPLFAAMADWALRSVKRPGDMPNNALMAYLLDPELKTDELPREAVPDRYHTVINGSFAKETYLSELKGMSRVAEPVHSKLHTEFGSAVARYRDGGTSVSVMTEASSFLSMRHGTVRLLAVQLATSFDPGTAGMQRLSISDSGVYTLHYESEKGYYGPVPEGKLPVSAGGSVSPWYLLPHGDRPVTHLQKLSVRIHAAPEPEGWLLTLEADGPEEVMVQLLFVFGGEGDCTGESLMAAGRDAFVWTGGSVRYETDGDWMELTADGDGLNGHTSRNLRNVQLPSGCRTLIANAVAPVRASYRIRLSGFSNLAKRGSSG